MFRDLFTSVPDALYNNNYIVAVIHPCSVSDSEVIIPVINYVYVVRFSAYGMIMTL